MVSGGGIVRLCIRFAALVAAPLWLSGCASPYFVHDPQVLLINRKEVPQLLKSVRCELATYVAADNLRTVLFRADEQISGVKSAREKYSYFALIRAGTAASLWI